MQDDAPFTADCYREVVGGANCRVLLDAFNSA